MQEARIYLARMSPLLRRIITDLLAQEEGIEIVGAAEGTEESLVAARAEGANMIIAQDQRHDGDACLGSILSAVPLTILAIEPGGSAGISIHLLRRRLSLEDKEGGSLTQAVRKALEPL